MSCMSGALGGFDAVAARLPALAALGITAVELMPVADFPGPRNWGYDGVLPFAPDSAYGTPSISSASSTPPTAWA
jgi:maltooligosyltrehalose trehalohydrolase